MKIEKMMSIATPPSRDESLTLIPWLWEESRAKAAYDIADIKKIAPAPVRPKV